MVIDLTLSEKRTFFRFLALYLGSSFILMFLIAFFYFQNESRLYFDLTKSKMQHIVSTISAKIIYAHMTENEYEPDYLLKNSDYKIAFYNGHKKKMFGNLDDEVDFNKKIIQHEDHFILTDDSTLGHLGVFYIAIQEHVFIQKINNLKLNIVIFFLIIYSLVVITSFYLAKLFLKPIKEERLKLNNFLKDTTHELNTPISAILMSTESNSLNEKQIQRVRLSAKRVSEIYKDLTYTFLQENTLHIAKVTQELKSLIKEQLEYFEPLCNKKKINIILELKEVNYLIAKDDFIRLFNNLMSNAVKYNIIDGNITITLDKEKLIIKDSGIGISDDKIKDIFKRYYRATSEQGGFGIGLSIVNHICKTYKIKLEVSSKINIGTTFTLNF